MISFKEYLEVTQDIVEGMGAYDNDSGIKHTRDSLVKKIEALPKGSHDFEWHRARSVQHLSQGNSIRARYHMAMMKRHETKSKPSVQDRLDKLIDSGKGCDGGTPEERKKRFDKFVEEETSIDEAMFVRRGKVSNDSKMHKFAPTSIPNPNDYGSYGDVSPEQSDRTKYTISSKDASGRPVSTMTYGIIGLRSMKAKLKKNGHTEISHT